MKTQRTPEEKAQARAVSQAERIRFKKVCSPARIDKIYTDNAVALSLDRECLDSISVSWRSEKNGKWDEMAIYLSDDMEATAQFISGLVSRFNELVSRINEKAAKVAALETLHAIPTSKEWQKS